MKKKLILFIFLINCLIFGNAKCFAASASIKSSSTSITKGSKVTITLTVNSDSPLVSIEGTLKCSGAGVNGGIDLRFDDSSNSLYSKTYTYSVTPTTSGTLSCYSESVRLTEMSKDTWQNIGNKQVSITVKEPQVIPPKQLSSNNYLTSLSVEGYEFDKTFDKEVLEYSVELPVGTEKIKINAKQENSNAKINGSGEVVVIEGINKIEVKVTAENGNVKTYIINATVKELEPIIVDIDKKKYTIVRKEGVLDPIEGYEKTTVKIGDDEVLAYYNEITKYTLVILKDEEGNSNYYLYKNNNYTLYKEYNFSDVKLYLLDTKKPDNCIKKEIIINEEKIEAYQLDNNKKNTTYALDTDSLNSYYLVYAMNVNNGKENYYLIDKEENTAIRFSEELQGLFLNSNVEEDNYKAYFFITLGIFGFTLLMMGIISMIKSKKKRNKTNFK